MGEESCVAESGLVSSRTMVEKEAADVLDSGEDGEEPAPEARSDSMRMSKDCKFACEKGDIHSALASFHIFLDGGGFFFQFRRHVGSGGRICQHTMNIGLVSSQTCSVDCVDLLLEFFYSNQQRLVGECQI